MTTGVPNYSWDDPFWEILRFYTSLRGTEQKTFLKDLESNVKPIGKWKETLGLDQDVSDELIAYCRLRSSQLTEALDLLRSEKEAQAFCKKAKIKWGTTATKSKDHHQSSKALIATVSSIASDVCKTNKTTLEPNPQKRCIWLIDKKLHVSARNLDGAIPSLRDPKIVWEIKEYWGKTSGGSKMSDAVYECHLVGKEIREYEKRAKTRIYHLVFLDGKDQWLTRKSDLARFIDLKNQGVIDRLFIGKEVETEFKDYLTNTIVADL